MGGFSKAYAMTGWRVGYVAGPAAILEGMVKVHQYGIMSAPTTAQDAALGRHRRGRGRRRADARRVRPSPAADRRRAQRAGPRDVRAARRLLRLPADRLDRARRRDVRRAAPDRGARGGRARGAPSGRRAPATCACATRRRTSGSRRRCGGSAGSWSGLGPDGARPRWRGLRPPPPRRSSASSIAQIASGRRYRLPGSCRPRRTPRASGTRGRARR